MGNKLKWRIINKKKGHMYMYAFGGDYDVLNLPNIHGLSNDLIFKKFF